MKIQLLRAVRTNSSDWGQGMADTLVLLLVGHLVGDFLLQPDAMVCRKKSAAVLLGHGAIVTAATAVVIGGFPPGLLAAVLVSHLLIDAIKVRWGGPGPTTFVVDQAAHLLGLCLLAAVFSGAAAEHGWLGRLTGAEAEIYRRVVVYLGGVTLCVPAGGALVGAVVAPLARQVDDPPQAEGLSGGGRMIGWLERALIFLLMISQQTSGVGFLFAAKSILRFGEIKDPKQRKMAEYIIIGTFLSFAWALLSTYLTMRLLVGWAGGHV